MSAEVPNGDFSILLSAERPDGHQGNWLALEGDIHMIMVRQYYHGRQGKTVASLKIRNLDAPEYQPPGEAEVAAGLHHATRSEAAGFCVFNDCGVAIETLRSEYAIQRVAYVDIDAHHGDGVEDAFFEEHRVTTLSIRSPSRSSTFPVCCSASSSPLAKACASPTSSSGE